MLKIMHNKFLKHLLHLNNIKRTFTYMCFTFLIIYLGMHMYHLQALSQKNQKIYTITPHDENTYTITITFPLQSGDFIYHDFFTFSSSHPAITISHWKTNYAPITYYDPLFKDTKRIYNKTVSIFLDITIDVNNYSTPSFLLCSYFQRSKKKIKQLSIPLPPLNIVEQSTIATNCETQHKPYHIRYYHTSSPFITYYTCINQMLINFMHEHSISWILWLLITTLCLCIIPAYLFPQHNDTHRKLKELIEITRTLLGFIVLCYLFLYIHTDKLNRFIIPDKITKYSTVIVSLGVGIFYLSRSVRLHWKYLRTLCSFLGYILIILSVFLCFKTIQ